MSNNNDPARNAAVIVPNDSVQLGASTRGIYVGTGGDITAVLVHGDEVTFKNVTDGSLLPIEAKMVKQSTTASDLVAVW